MTEQQRPDPNVVLAAAEQLGARLDNMRDEFANVQTRLTTYKRVIVGLAVVAALSVAGLVVSLVVAVQANHASHTATSALSKANLNQQAAVTTCKTSNDARAVSKTLWLYVIDLSLAQPTSPSQDPRVTEQNRQLLTGLRTKVIKTYAARDCSPAALQHSPAPH